MERHESTPQGGPLSPLLADVRLDEIDQELERRGHRFVRYADDCNVYVRSRRAGEEVLAVLRQRYAKLRLRINEEKSAVALAWDRTFLGYRFWQAGDGTVKRGIAAKALEELKHRVRRMTRRSGGRSIEQVARELGAYLTGWKGYFQLAETVTILLRRFRSDAEVLVGLTRALKQSTACEAQDARADKGHVETAYETMAPL